MRKLFVLLVASLSMTFLAGCATIVNGRYQQVSMTTKPPGANCVLTNNKGLWQVSSTPAQVAVHRSMDDLHITCQKPGYAANTAVIQSHTKKMIAGNLVFGGIVGGVIDAGDGSAFSYPSQINVNLVKK